MYFCMDSNKKEMDRWESTQKEITSVSNDTKSKEIDTNKHVYKIDESNCNNHNDCNNCNQCNIIVF